MLKQQEARFGHNTLGTVVAFTYASASELIKVGVYSKLLAGGLYYTLK